MTDGDCLCMIVTTLIFSVLWAGLLMLLVAVAWVGLVQSGKVPAKEDDARLDTPPSNFIGEGTNELATTLLQVSSPLYLSD